MSQFSTKEAIIQSFCKFTKIVIYLVIETSESFKLLCFSSDCINLSPVFKRHHPLLPAKEYGLILYSVLAQIKSDSYL